ncbi:polysaccharide deacetylase family protein [Natranaerofaba carboxydovora]|uniref:polysaccharide deacetylase family protein n=1 Tax=Natranaerofaba carboxydovora TaxID=2742683 RepID=UPI001F1381C8|nr:polysaccharide deacetylase family protein [Natranaerofaba carboxydovora]UMZ72700.1 Polysaccharide deacetylase [Natranaerofaba carboxydovora]
MTGLIGRNVLLLILLFFLISSIKFDILLNTSFAADEVDIIIDGEEVKYDKDKFWVKDNNILMPLDFVKDNLDVEINNYESEYQIKKDDKKVFFYIGEKLYIINDEKKEKDFSPYITEDYNIIMPLNILEGLGIIIELDQAERKLKVYDEKEPERPGLITFVLDDGSKNQYEMLYPLFKEKEIPANWSPATVYLDELDDFATWEMIYNVYKNSKPRWEISSHSSSHPNLTNQSNERIRIEAEYSKRALSEFEPVSFVYPYYQYNDRVIEQVKEHYDLAYAGSINDDYNRPTGNNGANDIRNINSREYVKENPYEIKRVTLTGPHGNWNSLASHYNLERLVDKTKEKDGLLAFTLHKADENSVERLRELINYIKEVDVPVGTSYDVIDEILED